ncbi:MAG TPA: hypothetical protein VF532_18720 [Candidatus Angelobacter sp.]
MPVARIITDHPERTDALSRQLETQGYTVEVVRRRAAVAAPADLEIDFEIWPEESVLDHAATLAEELHADVAVAPGLELESMEAAPPQPGLSTAEEPQASDFPGETIAPRPADETAPLPPVQFTQPEPVRTEPDPVPNFAAGPPVIAAQAKPTAPQEAAQGAWHERALEPDEVFFAPEQREPARDLHAPVMQDTVQQQTSSAGFLAELWKALDHVGRELGERWRIRLAEKNAEREERLLELTERKTLAQVRANELQAAREAASARLKELVRAGGTEPAPAPATRSEETAPTFVFAQPESRLSALKKMLLGRRSSPQVQAILTGVAAVTALFVLGMAIASFRPRPALSNSLDQPYKGVTVQTRDKTVTGAAPAPVKTKTAPRPSPAARSNPNTGKQSPAHRAGDDVTVKRMGTGASGSDVSVRHTGPTQSKPAAKATPQGGMKHISDLDN